MAGSGQRQAEAARAYGATGGVTTFFPRGLRSHPRETRKLLLAVEVFWIRGRHDPRNAGALFIRLPGSARAATSRTGRQSRTA